MCWIREIKSRFRSQKLSKQKKHKFESKRFRSAAAAALFNPLFSQNRRVLLRGFCRRARIRVRRIDRAFASRSGLCSFETNTRSIIIACTRRSAKRESFATELQTKKNKKKHLSAYREQRHRVSSVDRFFAGREGHVRSSRNRFHGTLSLQAFGLGDRRFRAHVDGLDDRSHYYSYFFACCYEDEEELLRSGLCLREKIFL